jgi:hypothetical protein
MPISKDVVGARTVTALEETFKRYLAMDPGLALVLALWTIATHLFDCFDAFPYLAITSPTKRCGKTRLAEIIELFSCEGLRTVGASAAAIFRTIQMQELNGSSITLIMDEAEVLGTRSERAETLREILNAGYRRGQYVLRCGNPEQDHEPQRFSVYCPKVIVLIGNLQDTLADRCIPIRMRRRKPCDQVERFFHSQVEPEAKRFRKQVGRWAKASRHMVKTCHRRDLKFLEDREAELWSPLFATCAVAAPNRLDELKAIALQISGAKQAGEPEDFGVLMLRDVREIFERNGTDRISTSGLLYALPSVEGSPWGAWGHGRGLDARGLARLLRPFGIEPHNLRLEENLIAKGYKREDFTEAWADYLGTASSSSTGTELSESSDPNPPASAT